MPIIKWSAINQLLCLWRKTIGPTGHFWFDKTSSPTGRFMSNRMSSLTGRFMSDRTGSPTWRFMSDRTSSPTRRFMSKSECFFEIHLSALKEISKWSECLGWEFQAIWVPWKRISSDLSALEEIFKRSECVEKEFQVIQVPWKRIPSDLSALVWLRNFCDFERNGAFIFLLKFWIIYLFSWAFSVCSASCLPRV